MTEEYFRQQVYVGLEEDSDETIIYKFQKDDPDQASLAPRFEVEREDGKAYLYILWSKTNG